MYLLRLRVHFQVVCLDTGELYHTFLCFAFVLAQVSSLWKSGTVAKDGYHVHYVQLEEAICPAGTCLLHPSCSLIYEIYILNSVP